METNLILIAVSVFLTILFLIPTIILIIGLRDAKKGNTSAIQEKRSGNTNLDSIRAQIIQTIAEDLIEVKKITKNNKSNIADLGSRLNNHSEALEEINESLIDLVSTQLDHKGEISKISSHLTKLDEIPPQIDFNFRKITQKIEQFQKQEQKQEENLSHEITHFPQSIEDMPPKLGSSQKTIDTSFLEDFIKGMEIGFQQKSEKNDSHTTSELEVAPESSYEKEELLKEFSEIDGRSKRTKKEVFEEILKLNKGFSVNGKIMKTIFDIFETQNTKWYRKQRKLALDRLSHKDLRQKNRGAKTKSRTKTKIKISDSEIAKEVFKRNRGKVVSTDLTGGSVTLNKTSDLTPVVKTKWFKGEAKKAKTRIYARKFYKYSKSLE
jgi:hypothetical protein